MGSPIFTQTDPSGLQFAPLAPPRPTPFPMSRQPVSLADFAQQQAAIQAASDLAQQATAASPTPIDKPAMERARLAAITGAIGSGSPQDALRALAAPAPRRTTPADILNGDPAKAMNTLAASGQTPPSPDIGYQQSPTPAAPATSSYATPTYTNASLAQFASQFHPTQASQDQAYQRYRENMEGPVQATSEDAQTAMNRVLTRDPFAPDFAKAQAELGMHAGLAQFSQGLQQEAATKTRSAFMDQARQEAQNRDAAKEIIRRQFANDPREMQSRLGAVDDRYKQNLDTLRNVFGFEKITGKEQVQ